MRCDGDGIRGSHPKRKQVFQPHFGRVCDNVGQYTATYLFDPLIALIDLPSLSLPGALSQWPPRRGPRRVCSVSSNREESLEYKFLYYFDLFCIVVIVSRLLSI